MVDDDIDGKQESKARLQRSMNDSTMSTKGMDHILPCTKSIKSNQSTN